MKAVLEVTYINKHNCREQKADQQDISSCRH
jgi:hypothetical protein